MSIIEPKSITCFRCDFGSGQRGMDFCGRCGGTGSGFHVGPKFFPNTKQGYINATCALNDPEGEREEAETRQHKAAKS